MTTIRVIFDGKAFIPQRPVSLPDQAEAIVITDQDDAVERAKLDAAVRAYYEGGAEDGEDAAWGKATASQAGRAWDED